MKYCAKCGQQMPDEVRYCAACGAPQADVKLKELSSRLDRQAAELEAVRQELRAMQAADAGAGTKTASLRNTVSPAGRPETGRPTAVYTAAGQRMSAPSAQKTSQTVASAGSRPVQQTAAPASSRPAGHAGPRPAQQKTSSAAGTPGGIEFGIAATVLSVIGVLFLISALMIFGASFLSGMAQGLFLFAVFAALTAFSELWIRKRLPRFAEITSALGLAGLYAAALINYYSLKTLPGPAVLAITLLISGFAVWLSRRRDSLMLRLVLFLGSYTAMIMTGEETPGLIAAFLTFFINLAAALLPVRRNRAICSSIHMITYALFTIYLQALISDWSLFGHNSFEARNLLPVGLFLTVMECIRLVETRSESFEMAPVWYLAAVPTILLSLFFTSCNGTQERFIAAGMLSVPIILGTAAGMLALKRGKRELYRGAYALIILWMLIGTLGEDAMVVLPVSVAAMIISLLIARREGSSNLITLHLVITIIALMTAASADMPKLWVIPAITALILFRFQPGLYSAHAAAVILYTVESIHGYFRIYHPAGYTMSLYTDLVSAAAILVLTLILQRVPGKRDRGTVLLGQFMLLLILMHHECLRDCDQHLVYILFLLVGSAAVFLLCGEKMQLPGRGAAISGIVPQSGSTVGTAADHATAQPGTAENASRPMPSAAKGLRSLQRMPSASKEFRVPVPGWLLYAAYLTYMILVIDIPVPVWISILLLALACGCVGFGFRMKLRYLRLYGLGLAIFACVKIAVYDFGELSSGMRVGVFLAAGLLALAISFIYIRLEKKESEGGSPMKE